MQLNAPKLFFRFSKGAGRDSEIFHTSESKTQAERNSLVKEIRGHCCSVSMVQMNPCSLRKTKMIGIKLNFKTPSVMSATVILCNEQRK